MAITRTVMVIDAGTAMTRGVLIRGEKPVRFHFSPALGDEEIMKIPYRDDVYVGRVMHIDRNLGMGFVDLGLSEGGVVGLGREAMVRLNGAAENLIEGALYRFQIRQLARGSKRIVVALAAGKTRPRLDEKPGPLVAPKNAVFETFAHLKNYLGKAKLDEIIVSSGSMRALVTRITEKTPIKVDAQAFGYKGADVFFSSLCKPGVLLPSGGALTIEEGEALTAIDIDSAAMGAPSRAKLNEKLNREAASVIMQQIAARRIGGQIVIDFLPLQKTVFKKFDQYLRERYKALPGFGRAGWTPSGLFSFVLPRALPSLSEEIGEDAIGDMAHGTNMKADFKIRFHLCELEERLRKSPAIQFNVELSDRFWGLISQNPRWKDRLDRLYGARVSFCNKRENASEEFQIYENCE